MTTNSDSITTEENPISNEEMFKNIILTIVYDEGVIKGTELAARVLEEFFIRKTPDEAKHHSKLTDLYHQALNKLIEDQEIVEIEYTLPYMTYRVKSLYFPAHTRIKKVMN